MTMLTAATMRLVIPMTRLRQVRCSAMIRNLSAATRPTKKIDIHFGSSTGTAQLFAHELQSALEQAGPEATAAEVSVKSLDQTPNADALDPAALHLFVVSTAGVGEPPGMARKFYDSLDQEPTRHHLADIQFGVFGLGNSAAHPHHYNVAGKTLYEKLVGSAAQPWIPLALGDDADCIEEDYDQWQATVLKKLKEEQQNGGGGGGDAVSSSDTQVEQVTTTTTGAVATNTEATITPTGEAQETPRKPFGQRLQLVPTQPSADETTRTDLADVLPSYYHPDTQRWKVKRHQSLSPQPTANGLHELQLELTGAVALSYDAGDHLVVYPSQPDYLVEAYLDHWNIFVGDALHSTVQLTDTATATASSSYPHPTGISLYDTLRYCVDLMSPPSPKLARTLLRRDDIDYKTEVFTPRQSPLALLRQSGNTDMTLEDLLYQLPSIAPRYYSIASSPARHPNSLYLTYRPVRYFNSLGAPQQGLCTSYFQQLQAGNTVMAYVNRNPTFRLPTEPEAPIILLAGGCGVAAVRALVEELQARRKTTPVYIFLGFRNPADAAYLDVMESVEPVLLDVSYSLSCTAKDQQCALVSDRLQVHGAMLYDLLQNQGAYLYACGGARTFGAAIQRELYMLFEEHGHCSQQEAQEALQELVRQGRYCEDLAD
uniref:NADPH--hemoprotein reductase n=1 Tax=Amphora coffeiformis TaxID=265554 RepID=A0A6S8KMF9_9STRA